MDRFEMTEKLSKTAQVKYEVARFALEKNNWDILEALVYLESFKSADESVRNEPVPVMEKAQEKILDKEKLKRGFQQIAIESGNILIDFLKKLLKSHVKIYRKHQFALEIPTLLVAVLMIIFYRSLIPVIIMSFIFGLRYRLNSGTESRDQDSET